ncbi:MAG: 50S ribosome-binding GTPase [Candidatus Hodgkinia cicadicola]|nr:MAG: 50S ribosome-binding GTPase [Candidatus Hodgkinia cicadicola]
MPTVYQVKPIQLNSRSKLTIFGTANRSPCAITTIRVSGDASLKTLASLTGKLTKPNKACVCKLKLFKASKNNCVVTWRPSPYSPTGEDYVEVCVPGSTAIVDELSLALLKLKLLPASKGEFTKRALANKKLEVHQVFALAKDFEISCSLNETKTVIRQMDELTANLEGCFQTGFGANAYKIKSLSAKLKQLEALSKTTKSCIVGLANTGKSSLLNAITGQVHSIVNKAKHTTRDSVCVPIHNLLLFDTAGFETSENEVGRKALHTTFYHANTASVVLATASDFKSKTFVRCKSLCAVVLVISKADLVHKLKRTTLQKFVSSYTLEGVDKLKAKLCALSKASSKVGVTSCGVLADARSLINQCWSPKQALKN